MHLDPAAAAAAENDEEEEEREEKWFSEKMGKDFNSDPIPPLSLSVQILSFHQSPAEAAVHTVFERHLGRGPSWPKETPLTQLMSELNDAFTQMSQQKLQYGRSPQGILYSIEGDLNPA